MTLRAQDDRDIDHLAFEFEGTASGGLVLVPGVNDAPCQVFVFLA